ncbi:MAG: hypothetical protein VR64_16750 [Desulfatitalea sp. BRH_c12]|nr:MAG: hypothetical protein VR64_16750 [Desulfatitalea sp. BRH_c12]
MVWLPFQHRTKGNWPQVCAAMKIMFIDADFGAYRVGIARYAPMPVTRCELCALLGSPCAY